MIDNILVIRLTFLFSKLCTYTFSSALYLFRASSSSSLQRSYNPKQLEPSVLAFIMTIQGVFDLEMLKKPRITLGFYPATRLICIAQKARYVGFLKYTGLSCIVATANLWAVSDRCIRSAQERVGFQCIEGQAHISDSPERLSSLVFRDNSDKFSKQKRSKISRSCLCKGNKILFTIFRATPRFEKSGLEGLDLLTRFCH